MTHGLTTARSEPRSYELRPDRAFGHARHVGTCAACQRAQLARWRAQLLQASAARVYQEGVLAPLISSGTTSIWPQSG
jgi:hypothetical protein